MVIPQLGYGGAEGSFMRVAEYLERSAVVTLAVMAQDYGMGSGYSVYEPRTSIPIVQLDNEQGKSTWLTKPFRWYRMRKRLSELKASHDVTISFLPGANLLNALAGLPARTIVSERGAKRCDTGRSRLSRTLWTYGFDRFYYRRASCVVAASEGLAGEIAGASLRARARTRAIEGTVLSESILHAANAPLEAGFEQFARFETVLEFGRLHHQKGYDFLLRVFAGIRQQRPNARLLVVGDGPELNALMAQATQLGLRAGVVKPRAVGLGLALAECDVVFAGYRTAPWRFAQVARCVVIPSRYEGLPNTLIEAVATGRPVLVADCPWGPRSVLGGEHTVFPEGSVSEPMRFEAGMLMPPIGTHNATDIWAREISGLLDRPPSRRSPAECRSAIARFDIEATGPQWLALATQVAAEGRDSSAR